MSVTQERLKELFNLDPKTGVLYWKVQTGPRVKVGDVAGHLCENGYWRIRFDGKNYYRHRLVFLFHTGVLQKEVDHCNRVRGDDRPINLRAATRSQNSVNSVRCSTHGLPKGVRRNRSSKNPFQVLISINGKMRYLGSFPTLELADQAYRIAASQIHGEFACFGKDDK
jgi:hypothetical protein